MARRTPRTPRVSGLHRGIGQGAERAWWPARPRVSLGRALRSGAFLVKSVRVLRAGGPRNLWPAPTVIQRAASAGSAETVLPPRQG